MGLVPEYREKLLDVYDDDLLRSALFGSTIRIRKPGSQRMKRHLRIAILVGVVISAALFGLNFAIDADRHTAITNFIQVAQYPGWIICVLLRGFESYSTAEYIAIAIPINSVMYGAAILAGLRLRIRLSP